jgi:hypothetical protein
MFQAPPDVPIVEPLAYPAGIRHMLRSVPAADQVVPRVARLVYTAGTGHNPRSMLAADEMQRDPAAVSHDERSPMRMGISPECQHRS